MHKRILGSLTGLLIPFTACGAHTAYGAYQRRPSAQVAAPLPPIDQHKPPVDRSSITGEDQPDLIAADNELGIAAGAQARELVIIDAAVPDRAVLQNAARPGVDVVLLEAGEDALEQTAALLENYRNLDAVHLVSHGDAGAILLGDQRIDKTALEAQPDFLAALNAATRSGADLLLYGCDLAKDDTELLELIQQNSHLDIAASNDLTGAAELGGDWTLEIAAGNIETTQAFSSKALQDFSEVLRPFGTQLFEVHHEVARKNPSIDWDNFTTYADTPTADYEVMASEAPNWPNCEDGPGKSGLYVSFYFPASRFFVRSNPGGERFGVTGLNVRAPASGTVNPADEVTIFGYDDSATLVGTKGPIALSPDAPTGTAIDLTTGVTGSFADIVRFRIAPDNFANDEVDFCLISVDFTPPDNDGGLTAAGGVTGPAGLDTTVDTAAEAVDVLDFTLSDGGTSDMAPLKIPKIVVNVSGTATDAERNQITWRLDGPDAGNVIGSYDAGTDTITFSGLDISIEDGASSGTYTIDAWYNDNSGLSDGLNIQLSLNGEGLTTDPGGSRGDASTSVSNDITIDAVATQLAFTTQPAGSVSGETLTTQPVVEAQDAFGNIDSDFTGTITLTETSAGTLTNNTRSASGGTATFNNLAYYASADHESFTLTGNGGGLPAADANPLASDVVATELMFIAQPAPTTVTSNLPTALTSIPVVGAVDASGGVDTDYSTDIILAEVNGLGSANISASGDTDGDSTTVTVTPNNGVSTFTGMNITYLSSGGDETFNLRAVSGALAADSAGFTANHPPTAITLDSNNANHSDGVNGVVGSLSTADLDTLNSHSYSLVAGAGDTDNGSFNISGNQLRVDDAESLEPGSYNVRIQTEDNHGYTLQEAFTITVADDLAPGVSNVSVPANATYSSGGDLYFTVNTSENVLVSGTPRIPLILDSSTVYAHYNGGSGTSVLAFRYTVQAGDNDTDGIELGAAIELNGATLEDGAGNSFVTGLNNVGATAGVLVDAVPPDAPSAPDLATASDTGLSSTDNITADTTPTLTGTAEANSTVSVVSSIDGILGTTTADGSGNWSCTPGATLSEGVHSITATSTDATGNQSSASAGLNVTIDSTTQGAPLPPDLAATSDLGNSDSDNITSDTTPTLNGTAEANSVVTIVSNLDGTPGTTTADGSGNWSFTPGTSLSDGTHGLTVFATDTAGNESSASFPLSVTLDSQASVVNSLNPPANATYTDGQNLEFTVDYDEAVTVTGAPRLELTIGASTRYATYTSGSGSSTLVFRHTVQAGDNDDDGIALDTTLDANGGTLRDTAGNDANLDLGTVGSLTSVLVDAQGASVDAVTLPGDANYTAGQELEFAVNYDDAVIVDTSDGTPRLELTIGATTRYANYFSGSGTSTLLFRYTVSAGDNDSDGIALDPTLDANGGTLQDVNGNDADNNLGTIDSLASVLVDTEAPLIDSVSVPADATYTAGDNLVFTVNTNEDVTVTGTPRIPLTLDGSSVHANYIGGSGTSTLEFRYTVQQGDSDTGGVDLGSSIELNGGTLMDNAGNNLVTGLNSVGATAGVLVDAVAPDAPPTPDLAAASDSGASSTDNITADTTPTLTGTAEADSTVTVISDIDGTLGTAAADGSGNWSFIPGTPLSEGVGAHAITATATDAVGNTSASSGVLLVAIDITAPSAPTVPELAAASDTGLSDSDNITSDTTPTLSGTAEADSIVTIFSDRDGTLDTATADGSGNWSFTSGISLSDGIHDLTVFATDAAGNESVASPALSVTLDSQASVVNSLNPPANATYTDGQILEFTVEYDEAVTVTGAPQLELTIGATTRYATYISGSGSSTLVFRHTVQAGDNDNDGIALDTTLDANGGSLRDTAGNDANLNLGTIGNLTSVLVDTQGASVDAVTLPADAIYVAGQELEFTINYDDAVIVDTSGGTPQLVLTIGSTTRYANYVSGSGTPTLLFRYTVSAGDNDSDGIALDPTLDANGGTLQDVNGNDADNNLGTIDSLASVLVDTEAPLIDSVSVPADATYTAGDNLDFTVNTSEDVTVSGTPRIPLTLDGSTVYAEFIDGSGTSTLEFRYTVQEGDSDTDGIGVGSSIELSGGTLVDNAGNNLVTGLNSVATTAGVLVDAVAPDAPSIPDLTAVSDSGASSTDNITADATPTLTGTAEADSTVTVISDIDDTLGTATVDGSGNWSFTPGAALSDGVHSITATATDAAGNESPASAGLNVTIDSTAPGTPPSPDLAATSDLGNFDNDNITSDTMPSLIGTAEANSLVSIFSDRDGNLDTVTADGGGNWSFAPGTPLSDGTHGLTVFATDTAGNESAASNALPVTLDSQASVVISLAPPANATYTDGQNLEFTVEYDEAVTVTGAPRLELTIGATTRYATYTNGSGSSTLVFRHTVQAGDNDSDGIALASTVDNNGGTLRDTAGNDANFNLGTIGSLTSVLVDTQGASVEAVTLPADTTYIAGQELEFAVNYDDAVIVDTSGGTPRLALTIGATTRYATFVDGSGSSTLLFRYTVQSGDNDSDGIALDPTLDADGGTLQDEHGNHADNNLGAIGSLASVRVDTQAPEIDSVSVPADATYTAGDNLDFTVNTSEDVTVDTSAGTPHIPLTLDGVTVFADYIDGSGTSALAFRYTVQTGDSDTDGISLSALQLNGGSLGDHAGNSLVTGLNSVGATAGVLVDAVAPDIPSTPDLAAAADSGVSDTDNFTAVVTPILTGTAEANSRVTVISDIDGTLGTAAADDSGNWSFTPAAALSENLHSITATATDPNGNISAASSGLKVNIDISAPVTPAAPDLAAASDWGASDSDNLTSDTRPTLIGTAEVNSIVSLASDQDGALGTVTAGDSGNWSFTPGTPLSDNTHSLTATATDLAGNTSSTSNTLSITLESRAPLVNSITLPADATYTAGQDLGFTVHYDEAVTVTGVPQLELTIGTTARYATYVSGSGSNALLFRHTVQAGDSDSDGIALDTTLDANGGSLRDAAGNDADTNLGTIGSLAGVLVDNGEDSDGDGVTDVQEAIDGTDPDDPEDYLDDTPPLIAPPADLSIDATGLYTPVTLRQLLALPANATEEEVQDALDALASDNIDGADCCATNAVTIASNGGAPRAIDSDLLWLAPGAHVIVWQGEDRKGNAGADTQGLLVQPLVSMQKDQVGAEGGAVTLRLFLNGLSGIYPLQVPYSIDASSIADSADHDLVDGNVTFTAGQIQQSVTVNLTGGDAVEGDETLAVGLDVSAVNPGARAAHTIIITENNAPPAVALDLQQNTVNTALVVSADGDVTVTANVSDLNTADTHSYDWSENAGLWGDIDGDTLVFDPTTLDPGVYTVRATVTDNDGASDTATLNFRVVAQAPALDSDTDSDGDGIDDLSEGFGDSDSDGIPDYRDNIAAGNVLPTVAGITDAFLIECEPGLLCRLGAHALAGEDGGAGIPLDALPEDPGFNHIGGLFDFEMHNLPIAGQAVRVAIPLQAPIPADAVYRKFDSQQWFTFVEDADNSLHSNAGEMGFCPPPGDASWQPGLVEGHLCLQLTIEDGGPNDGDGLANGSVEDPGGVAVSTGGGSSSSSSASSSGSSSSSASSSGSSSSSSSGGSSSSSSSSSSSGGRPTVPGPVSGKSKGGALGLPLALFLLSIALMRRSRRYQAHRWLRLSR